jgi:hypothetical protein
MKDVHPAERRRGASGLEDHLRFAASRQIFWSRPAIDSCCNCYWEIRPYMTFNYAIPGKIEGDEMLYSVVWRAEMEVKFVLREKIASGEHREIPQSR